MEEEEAGTHLFNLCNLQTRSAINWTHRLVLEDYDQLEMRKNYENSAIINWTWSVNIRWADDRAVYIIVLSHLQLVIVFRYEAMDLDCHCRHCARLLEEKLPDVLDLASKTSGSFSPRGCSPPPPTTLSAGYSSSSFGRRFGKQIPHFPVFCNCCGGLTKTFELKIWLERNVSNVLFKPK